MNILREKRNILRGRTFWGKKEHLEGKNILRGKIYTKGKNYLKRGTFWDEELSLFLISLSLMQVRGKIGGRADFNNYGKTCLLLCLFFFVVAKMALRADCGFCRETFDNYCSILVSITCSCADLHIFTYARLIYARKLEIKSRWVIEQCFTLLNLLSAKALY